jgi:hypothetical protein
MDTCWLLVAGVWGFIYGLGSSAQRLAQHLEVVGAWRLAPSAGLLGLPLDGDTRKALSSLF